MDEFEKNEILKQVGTILQFCQDIVSRLSSLPPPPAITEANESIAKFSDEEEEEVHQDEVPYDDDDLWWDSSSPPPQFYTLVFDDDEVSLYSLDESYADFLLPSDMLEDVRLPSDMLKDVRMTADKSRNVRKVPENTLMQSVFQFLQVATPNAIYDRNWREVQRRNAVHPEFFSLWNFSDSIFTDAKDVDVPILQEAAPEIEYPTIDLNRVNSRFIDNIPKPSLFPIHGVSSDPDFYHKWYDSNEPYKKIQKFRQPYPFGAEYGYETNVGVVLPSTEPVHGYIWCKGEGWRLYAVKPGDRVRTFQTSRRRT